MKARLPDGFSNKGPNMQNMLKQAQKMQEDLSCLLILTGME